MTKKNLMMRIASVLLIAVVLTTSVIGGTLAKYTSTATGSAAYTVASWSFKVNSVDIAALDTFTFYLATTRYDLKGTGTDTETDVVASEIAPGTQGSFDFVLTNSSDVTASYTLKLTAEALSDVPDGLTADQFPVVYSLDKSSWDKDITKIIKTNTLIAGASETVTVYWKWTFEGDDSIDTKFGITAPNVTITASVTATQVD